MLRLLSYLVILLAAGCTPPTPTLTAGPTASPGSTPSDRPSLLPTQTPAISPIGAMDIVLRMHHTGGFLFPGAAVDVAPAFTLFSDGSVIYRPSTVPLIGPAGPGGGLLLAQMSGQQIDGLVDFALGPGGLAEAVERYDDVAVADSPTTNFTINAGGVSKTVAVYALGDEMEPGPETAHRERFKVLAGVLGAFENEVARGNAADAGLFEPEAYRVTLIADEFGDLAPSGAWPWDDLTPDDFEPDQSGFRVRGMTPDETAPLFEVPPADVGDPVVVGPDEVNYLVRYRPLLPDELP